MSSGVEGKLFRRDFIGFPILEITKSYFIQFVGFLRACNAVGWLYAHATMQGNVCHFSNNKN